jgi:hypothetical protein
MYLKQHCSVLFSVRQQKCTSQAFILEPEVRCVYSSRDGEAVKLEALALWIGFALYLSNLALGVGVQFRWVSTKRFHWVHHALYGVVFVAAGAATLTAILAGSRWWAFLPTLLALGLLPRFRGGSGPHRNLALVGLLGYVLAFI